MDLLIPITGYAKSYDELCNKTAMSGEFYNVPENGLFTTYCKTGSDEIGDTLETTDVVGWYKTKADLESNIRPSEGECYITGDYPPYTRWKAAYINYKMTFIENGECDKKIVRNFKTLALLTKARLQPEEGVFYSLGKEMPFKIYGMVSAWEPVGSFITYVVKDMKQLINKPTKSQPGEVAFLNGLYYIYNGSEWERLECVEPVENVYKHTYAEGDKKFRIREGLKMGTLEFFTPKE